MIIKTIHYILSNTLHIIHILKYNINMKCDFAEGVHRTCRNRLPLILKYTNTIFYFIKIGSTYVDEINIRHYNRLHLS